MKSVRGKMASRRPRLASGRAKRCLPMTNAARKTFDTVEMMRAIRDELSARIATMSVEEENRWLRSTAVSDPTTRRLMELAVRERRTDEGSKEDPEIQG